MPRSLILYSDKTVYDELKVALDGAFGATIVRPYTLSFPNRAGDGRLRVRVTELADGMVAPFVERLLREGRAELASVADQDVRSVSYEELLDGADRRTREATVRFVSPTILEMDGRDVPFPVVPLMFQQWAYTWNAFAPEKLRGIDDLVPHVRITDFQISASRTARGVGFEGRVSLELDKGLSEEAIRLFNLLVDYASYCGTGLYTNEGLGQTGRLRRAPTGRGA
jgi:CRISPR/Cas system endoribonuclease Cas6 (RAMP superfamily)